MAGQRGLVLLLILPIFALSVNGKVFTECELVRFMRSAETVPAAHIPVWTCIAYYESRYNTTALSKRNRNGSRNHGIFQLNDKYWCMNTGVGGGCKENCASFRDDYLPDDFRCVKTIFAQQQRLQGDGFNAWTTYKTYCDKGRAARFARNC